MSLTIQYQLTEEACRHCHQTYRVVRGPVVDDGNGVALYLAGLHHCTDYATVVMTIAWKRKRQDESFTLQAWADRTEIRMTFINGNLSPWTTHEYLGRMLSADDARASELRASVFEVADLVCTTVPEVVTFLDKS